MTAGERASEAEAVGVSLQELQTWMAEMLRRPRALPPDREVAELARRYFTGNDRVSPVEQLEIYREQFWLRHTSSLIEDFPGLGGIIGQADWQRLAEQYLASHPLGSHTLRDLGERLPQFVQSSTWLEHHDVCVDMARLEWAFIELFDAPDVLPLDAAKVAGIPADAWQTARIVLSPALRLLSVRYPVLELRKRLREKTETVPIPQPARQYLALYRSRQRNLEHQLMSADAYTLLEHLQAGTPLVAAAEQSVRAFPEYAHDIESNIGEWFRDWAERGFIVDVI